MNISNLLTHFIVKLLGYEGVAIRHLKAIIIHISILCTVVEKDKRVKYRNNQYFLSKAP